MTLKDRNRFWINWFRPVSRWGWNSKSCLVCSVETRDVAVPISLEQQTSSSEDEDISAPLA